MQKLKNALKKLPKVFNKIKKFLKKRIRKFFEFDCHLDFLLKALLAALFASWFIYQVKQTNKIIEQQQKILILMNSESEEFYNEIKGVYDYQ